MVRCRGASVVSIEPLRQAVDSNRPFSAPGLLGDTAARDYSAKLRSFNAFAEPELKQAIACLSLQPGMRVLDAGCGTGEALRWLAEAVTPGGSAVGMDLSSAHVAMAHRQSGAEAQVLQADLRRMPFPQASFDRIWCANTLHHLERPAEILHGLSALLRPGGRIALGQSSLLPDMILAWDARLERLTNEAVRRYYRERYGLNEQDLTAVRALVGVLRQAGLREISVRTFIIERLAPLGPADEDYLLRTIFRDTWGERLRPYLPEADFAALTRLCDPGDDGFALRRPDFHFLQTFTVASGSAS